LSQSLRSPVVGAPSFEASLPPLAQVGSIPGSWFATAIAASLLVLAALMASEGLRIDPTAHSVMPYYLIGSLAAGLRFGLRSPSTRLQQIARDIAEWYGLFILIALMGATATYPLAAATHGTADHALQAIDRALGFDWVGWYATVAGQPLLQTIGRLAYDSIYITPAVLLGWFAWEGRQREARHFLAAFWLTAVITLALFHFMPAAGPLATLWHGPIPYMPESALWQPQIIPELRHHAIGHVDLGALRGLVSAPSFHTVAAVLYIAAAWPHRALRWPIVAVNVAMLLSTPVEGTHYLADMLAGAAVAIAVLATMPRLTAARLSARSAG
jgi:hypothetical protein